jgi:hypothetical protein
MYDGDVHPNLASLQLMADYYIQKIRDGKPYSCGFLSNECSFDSSVCVESWTCSSWSSCSNNQQTRTCTDSNKCGTTTNKPYTTQTCTSCTENWQCGSWSLCTVNNIQSRTCTDSMNCGTNTTKPETSQSCSYSCTPNWNCSEWSVCSNSKETRTCSDTMNCGTTSPAIERDCTMPSKCSIENPSACVNLTGSAIIDFIISLLQMLKNKLLN